MPRFTLILTVLLAVWGALPTAAQNLPTRQPTRYRRIEAAFAPNAPAATVGAGVWAKIAEGQPQLALLMDIESPGGRHITFRQLLANGLPVLDGTLKVNLLHNGTVLNVMDNLMNEPAIGLPAQDIGPAAAEAIALGRWGGYMAQMQLGLGWVNGRWEYVYQGTTFDGPEAATWNFRLSAATGEMLWSEPNNLHFHNGSCNHNHAEVDTPGTGYVFDPCPLTTASAVYGGQFVDNSDATNASLDAERVTVTLQDLTFQNGVFKLIGPHVALEDASSPTSAPVTSPDGNFFYNRQQNGFEDVMAYYHIDSYQRYIQSLGFTNIGNLPLRVDAHGYTDDQSSVSPNGTQTLMRIGDGCVDDGEDADVILHEYGHAISHFASNSNSGNERRGLDEGCGDYIAASYSRSVDPWHWEQVFTWDGHNTCWDGRDAAVTTNYNPSQASSFNIHSTGQWWSTALMRAWTIVGRTVSDRVFFEELYMNQDNMTLRDAALLAIDADIALYGGIHVPTYATIFCNMNLMVEPNCSTYINYVSTPDQTVLHPGAALHIGPNPVAVAQPLRYTFQGLQFGPAGINFQVVAANGQTVRQYTVTEMEGELPVQDLPPGMYHLVAQPGNGLPTMARSFVIL